MDYKKIKALLHNYWEGTTSIEEEASLKEYFNSDHVAKDLEQYRSLFVYFGTEKAKTSTQDFSHLKETTTVRRLFPRWLMSAASILILFSATFYFYNKEHLSKNEDVRLIADTYKDPNVAFEEAKAALFLISKGLNKGMKKTKEGVKKAKK